jgi:parallel beta-helix repeat protein
MQTKFTLKTVLIISLIAYSLPLTATIRYVSHTGSSTPPYTTWETAADSIQKCINYSVDGDTIIVANGVYKETLFVNKAIWLLGISVDSTWIDGRGLNGINIDFLTVEIGATVHMRNFTVIGRAPTNSVAIRADGFLLYLDNCKILDSWRGIQTLDRSSEVKNSFIFNTASAYECSSISDTTYSKLDGCLILNCSQSAIAIYFNDNPIIKNNIIIGNNGGYGTYLDFMVGTNTIINNSVSSFQWNIEGRYATDTALIINNISSYATSRGYRIDSKTDLRNNIAIHNVVGVEGPTNTNSDYNLYWNSNTHTTGGLAEHDIVADPMFVNDTIPTYGGSYDYHLQKYSPAIDAGDPNILDVDGSRSDIGIFGRPLGQIYTYQDLAPKPPANLTAVYDSGLVKLTWNKNTEAD